MSQIPRTMVGGISMPRLICGSNWFFGFSHTSAAKDRFIKELFDTPSKVADVVEVFARVGCNAFMSNTSEFASLVMKEVEQRTGQPMIWIATPCGRDGSMENWKKAVDYTRELGATFCFPHQNTTDTMLDHANRRLDRTLLDYLNYVRDAGMIPGLSSHAAESIICADNCEADVESYIQPYNAAGFLCQVETDWIQQVIRNAKKPVMTIKPLAAGRLLPPTGLAFVWNTIRDCDMVTVGTMSKYEAEEVIELSLSLLEKRKAEVELQATRSKKTLLKE